MSHFRTVIPIDLEAIKTLLPKGATVEKVTLDPKTNELAMVWHHQMLETGYTFPVEFPVENLKAQKLPKDVRQRPQTVIPAAIEVPPLMGSPKNPNLPPLMDGPKPGKKHTKKSSVST